MAIISNIDIARAIFEGSRGKTGHELHLYMQNVVLFLSRKRLLSKAKDILGHIKKIAEEEGGIIAARVVSAEKLSTNMKHHIVHALKHKYKAREAEIDEETDRALVGGLRIEVKDEVIDLTLRNKIEKLKKHLTKTA